ncbi:BAR domain-containing protein [Desulfobulbus oligotrophicus]|uniref:Nucleotide modification associated domain-containing protein n=1 Tax=Desulfobulbus oligotrophicus TaxID=1909699 RepID=A0A7T5VEK6_9BACT|nr:hypothetical protein [Desulfobulbus oligotrophicus]QQG66347.1 hypothetical protein HP555_10950 [Desulfobulbus oligotrophicus]
MAATQELIEQECYHIRDLLLEKNRKYGDSALSPLRVFSRADAVEQIKVRIDDKLSRIVSGQADDIEDTTLDLIGYLILLRVAMRREWIAEQFTRSEQAPAGPSIITDPEDEWTPVEPEDGAVGAPAVKRRIGNLGCLVRSKGRPGDICGGVDGATT